MARIVLIDDEARLLQTLARFLEQQGHEVVRGGSFQAVEEHLRPGRFEVLITDIVMPDFDGMKVLREVVEGQLNRAEVVVIAGAVGGAAAESVRSVLSKLGEMEVARIAMHPGSVQGFGQLGREGVPTFLLPANPVSALVVFEVMVRPLIRLSLGKRQPMRRVVQARALSPITSVPGRTGFLRGQLMRDQDTGEYLVQALGGAPGASSHLLATLAEANCLVVVPAEVDQVRTGEIVDVAFLAQRG